MWQIDPGTPVPAVCTNQSYGYVFPSPFEFHGGVSAANLTDCPRCGAIARLADAFSGGPVNGKLNVFTSNEAWQSQAWDIATGLTQLSQIAKALQQGQIDRKAALAEAAQISKPAAATLDWVTKLKLLEVFITILAGLIVIYEFAVDDATDVKLVEALKQNTEVMQKIAQDREKLQPLLNAKNGDLPDRPLANEAILETVVRKLEIGKMVPHAKPVRAENRAKPGGKST